MFLKFDVSKRYLENAHFHQIMVLLSYVHPRPCCTCVWRRCTHDVRKIFGCLNPPYPLSINQTFPLSLVNPLFLRTSYAHDPLLAPKAVDRPFINGAQSQRPNGRRRDRERRRETPDSRGIFHLKALLSYRTSIKTERREEICENGFTKFPSLSMNSLSIEHYERGEREGGGRCEMAASARED